MDCRGIVSGALRKSGVLAAGREARSPDLNDTFEALKGLYRQLVNDGTFGRLSDVVPITNYVAGENQRIFRNTASVETITFPELVTTDCGDLPPLDLSVIVIVDAFSEIGGTYIYDVPTRKWVNVSDLTLDDEAPLSSRDPEGLKALLATQIIDEYGNQLGAATVRQAAGFQSSLTNRFSNPEIETAGIYM